MGEESKKSHGATVVSPTVKVLAITILVVVAPLVLLGVAELALRVVGYGVSGSVYVRSPVDGFLWPNKDYYLRFHPSTRQPEVDAGDQYRPQLLPRRKPENDIRILILGGSTAEGFPFLDAHGFHSIAAAALSHRYPDHRFTVLNLGQSAMSSYYVRDTAQRVALLQPDVAVIYSGHNEYYGTIGAGSGGGHTAKLLYMWLKNFRLAQFVFDITNAQTGVAQPADVRNLMESRLDVGRFPEDSDFDRTVADRFIDNIDASVRTLRRMNIPVLVVQPVSNIIDMPPFRGDKAVQLFRAARAAEQDLDAYAAARDADELPFRARSILSQQLAGWAQEADVSFLDLPTHLTEQLGRQALSDGIFIDHLHFSHVGQNVLARAVAEAIEEIPEIRETLETAGDWPSYSELNDLIQFRPELDLNAMRSVFGLLQRPPFSDMEIPYDAQSIRRGIAESPITAENPDLVQDVFNSPATEALQILGGAMIEAQDWQDFASFLEAMVHVNPGNYMAHLNLARFMRDVDAGPQGVNEEFRRAYLLSDRDPSIRDEWDTYMETIEQTDPTERESER